MEESSMPRRLILSIACVATLLTAAPRASLFSQQKMDVVNLSRAQGMLRDAYQDVKKYYYDPKYHGVDIDALYRDYNSRMQNAASLSQAFRLNASYLDSLHDTHTFFSPPARPYRLDSGYRLQMYGENCFITRVRPGTDAQSKVRPGDQVLGYNNYAVSRSAFWQMNFYFNDLAPQQVSNLDLRDPDGAEPKVTVDSKLRELKKRVDMTGQDGGYDRWDAIREPQNFDHVSRQRWVDVGDVMVWKMPEFEMEDHTVDHIFADARKHRTLILDLRGNPGGYTVTLERMIGNIFDHEVTIGDRVGRKALKPLVAKTRGHDAFSGKLIVLVDSISASCAELFPRVVQLEHRGTVIGDRTAGAVMEARGFDESQGADVKVFYSFSITAADLTMKDGKSLEHTGVTPDEIVLPTAQDLASGKDTVLAHALELAGQKVDPVASGKIFPFEWLPD
jgi:C-terminal processing protease CtpA/Prc